jgi:ATPase family AAA domain-containing protein 3A/B
LAKKRIEYRLGRESQLNQDNLRKQEESIKRQEDFKKATIQYEYEMKVIY